MNRLTRRSLLLGSAATLVPWQLSAATPAPGPVLPWRNWSGALRCQPAARFAPDSEDELASFLAGSSGLLRPVGSGHSFSPLVPTDGHLVVIDQLAGMASFDAPSGQVTFGAGTRLSDVGPALLRQGRALDNLPDIDRQTLAGAIATATHGTGLKLRCLSHDVIAMRLVTPDGAVRALSRDSEPELFDAARVSLGALGIVTQVTLRTRPRYRLRALTRVATMDEALDGFLEQAAQHRHYELFPFVHSDYSMTLAIDETDAPIHNPPESPEEEAAFGNLLAALESVPIPERKAMINGLISQSEPAEAVDESHRILTNIRNDRFNEMEYAVELAAGPDCVREVLRTIEKEQIDVGFPLEVRTVAGDDSWLSMSSGSDAHVAISIHRQAGRDYRPYFARIERIFRDYGGRPHWGKVHSLGAKELSALYPHFRDFQALRAEIDPQGRMLNPHLRRLFAG